MKAEQKKAKLPYTSIKIKTEHYLIAKEIKDNHGINIDFFVGQAIVEKKERNYPKK